MKIGIAMASFFAPNGDPLVGAFSKLAEIGYETLDYQLMDGKRRPKAAFSLSASARAEYFKNIRREVEDSGLSVYQAHATYPIDFIKDDEFGESEADEFKKEIEATALLGAKYVVIHPYKFAHGGVGERENLERNTEMYLRLVPYLEEFDVYLAVENMFALDSQKKPIRSGCSFACDVLKYIEAVNSDRLVACLDTGHVNLLGESTASAVTTLGKRLKVLHIHDNYGETDRHAIMTYGNIDWREFILAVRAAKLGDDVPFSMEVLKLGRSKSFAPELLYENARHAYAVARAIIDAK